MSTQTATQQMVYLVDDDESLRTAVSRLLQTAGFTVHAFSSAAEFLISQNTRNRGCLLLDVRMPGGPSGLELQKGLMRQASSIPIIFLTGHGDIPMSVQAIKDGAFDFLTKPVRRETLISTVVAALEKEASIWESAERLRDLKRRKDGLTPAELAVYSRVVAGEPNKQITAEIKCSERTVKSHRASVMVKMGAASLAELVHIADELGEIG